MNEKKYNEALEQAKKELATCCSMDCDAARLIFRLFPQLRESEDERIRKEIINFLRSPFVTENITDEKIAPWLAYLEKQKEQKPADYDHEMWKNCEANFEGGKREVIEHPEKYGLQKPAEWSDEDEKIICSIRHILFEHAFENGGVDVNGDYCEDVYIQANDFLLSLRPSWKPSEEHLSALLAVFNDPNNIGSQTCQLALTDLYEQLKKL